MSAIRDRRGLIATELRNPAGLAIELLDNGSLFAIRHGDVMINQVLGSPVEGGLGNVYLRRRTRHGISSFPLLGPAAPSRFRASGDGAAWEGSVDGLDYSAMRRSQVGVHEGHIPASDVERARAVSEDPLQRQDVAAESQVAGANVWRKVWGEQRTPLIPARWRWGASQRADRSGAYQE